MITRETIDKVFETARVEEVIGDFVQLKRAGSNYKGLSPFSDERSPSFMVSPVKQIWKDFSSGKGGSVVTFLMEHEHFTYPEAIRFLANKYNIEIEETETSQEDKIEANEKESMYLVSEFAKTFFHETLLNSEEGKAIGLSYFKERGFTNETITKFGLGYSPETWDAFTKEALSKGYQLEFLEKVGLTITREDGKHFDRFKGRVMFPIQSLSGRNLGFGGRILTNDKKAAKYLNSPESEIYHKSKVLYGIFHAKQAIAKQNNCFLVEGYTDVIQMHQAGIENVVASSGTALTPDQIRLINRLTKNITVLFDGDAAGLRASIRGIDLILEEGMNVKVCTFPDGDDPDSFARKNSFDDLVSYLENNAKDFIQFKASLLMNEAQNDPIKKADLIRDMVVSISKIPDRIKREVYIQECARIMDISEQVLQNTLAQLIQKDISEAGKKLKNSETLQQKSFEVIKNEVKVSNEKLDILSNLEISIISILVLYGNLVTEFENIYINFDEEGNEIEVKEKIKAKISERIFLSLQEDEISFTNPLFQEVYNDLIQNFVNDANFDIVNYMNTLEETKAGFISNLMMENERYSLAGWLEKKQVFVKEKDSEEVLTNLVTETLISLREYLINKLIMDMMNNFSKEEENDLEELMTTINDYNKLKVSLTNKIGRIRSTYL
ncbi:DNA primase [Flavobacterium sp. RSB2_4_14]|uniref:DNA primase n=1 Tax=Flavobacterium sp. RSB2_4_14 TaxID=3447665 RepID=UPI003F2A3B30